MSAPNDLPNTLEQARLGTLRVLVGSPLTSALEPECGDVDFMRIAVEAGRAYSIDVTEPLLAANLFSVSGLSKNFLRDQRINENMIRYSFYADYTGDYFFRLRVHTLGDIRYR